MRSTIPPLLHTPSWRSAELRTEGILILRD
jgi:hypothetical protein